MPDPSERGSTVDVKFPDKGELIAGEINQTKWNQMGRIKQKGNSCDA